MGHRENASATVAMSPPPAGVNAQLRHLVYYHLDNGFLENALFFASRLHALEPRNGDATHLLALCNLRLGRYKAAFEYAKPKGHQPPHLGCAYVFAQACLDLEQYEAGIQALEKTRGLWTGRSHWNKHSDTSRRHVPDAAAVFCLLGKLYNGFGDTKKALSLYVESLSLNPFMWDAFTALCDMRAVVRPPMVFKITSEILASVTHPTSNGHGPATSILHDPFDAKQPFASTPDVDPFNTSIRPGADVGLNLGGSNLLSKLNGTIPAANGNGGGSSYPDVETPSSNGQNFPDEDVMMGDVGGPVLNDHTVDITHAPSRKTRMHPVSANEDPPRMRPITSRTRIKTTSETTERTEIPQPVGHWQNGHKRTVSGQSTQHVQQLSTQPADPTAAPPRRSARLFNSISQIRPSSGRLAGASSRDPEAKERRELRKAKATGTKGKPTSASTVGRVVSGNRKPTVEISESLKPESRPASVASIAVPAPPPKMSIPAERPREPEVLNWILELLRRVGSGYLHLSRFECVEALKALHSVPDQQRETPWVLAQIGKAYYERSMYMEAEKMFQRIRELAPSYMEDMEVFSNALWQLKKETELAYLAHTLVDQDRLSPQAWCALGNAFSLQREHDQAIKCFTRATQLDPKFAYAFTLQGHEHIQNEEYDKATFAYRCAVSANNTHYNGWYGLGCVYEKLGKYEVAEKHYRAAFQFNATNPLLAVRIGSVLERMKKIEPALTQYEAAIRLDPRSTLARFRRATILLKLDSPDEALQELLYLKDAAPEDANVHFTLGRAYKKMRNRTDAIRHFTIALNLDPKAQSVIKQVMESWDDDGDTWSSEDEG